VQVPERSETGAEKKGSLIELKEYLSTADVVLEEQQSGENGLTPEEAAARLEKHGKNKLKEAEKETLLSRFIGELKNPMILVLLAAALVSGITAVYSGESFADVIIILAVVIINAVLGVFQESKAEKAIEALQAISAATCQVMRGGFVQTIRSEELVPGDVILLEAGDAVPADARILESASLQIEEAALTGESLPVNKSAEALDAGENADVPLGDRVNMCYMGSTVVYGRGRAVVVATGMETEMGKIAGALSLAVDRDTPLQRRMDQLSGILSILVLAICVVIFAVDIFRGWPDISTGRLLDTFMVAVSLAVAAIPEGLAAVVTVVLSIGVTNMSKHNAVIRRLTAVETLGCTQIICSDKTGTLTQNRMTVVDYAGADEHMLVTAMALCNDAEPDEDGKVVGEPTECALVDYAIRLGLKKSELEEKYPRIGEVPFDSMRKMMTTVHRAADGTLVQFTKGAPDEVLRRCTHVLTDKGSRPLTDEARQVILQKNQEYGGRALRVLCAATRGWKEEPTEWTSEALEEGLCFVGLCGMIDPVRPEVVQAIQECRTAGIRPIMITGDHRDTAIAIASELGILSSPDEAITGAMLDEIDDEDLPSYIEKYSVYARVQPEHKVRIVNAWRAVGKVTAMTGDGVNDAPSIKNADIGIGMGITGTDVTKNVADMVLADDNFATIVSAVKEGRCIYANIRKAIQFLLASNVSEVMSILISMLMGFTILRPVHLLWINLITDTFPALALGMEDAEDDVMRKPPRDSNEGIFAGGMGFDIAFQGILVTLITLTAYFVGHYMESGLWEIKDSPDGMTMAFIALSMSEIFHSMNMRSRRRSIFTMKKQNLVLLGAMAMSFVCTTLVIYVPFLSRAFGFESISLAEYVVAILLAATIIPIVEIVKYIQQRMGK